MKNTKTVTVYLPAGQLRAMERTARKENRTVSELVQELYRRYIADETRSEFGHALEALRAEAEHTPASKFSMRQINADITAARRARRRKSA